MSGEKGSTNLSPPGDGGDEEESPTPPASFDMSSLEQALGSGGSGGLMDMVQQLSQDPQFKAMTENLQSAFGAAGSGAMPPGMGGMPGGSGGAGFDPSQYMSMMNQMMSDPSFMQFSEQLYSQAMSDPGMSEMLKSVQSQFTNTASRDAMQQQMEELKKDPSLAHVIEDIEQGGPQAMMKYWNDPEVLSKLGRKMQGVMPPGAIPPGAIPSDAAGSIEEAEESEPNLHDAVSNSNVEQVKQLIAAKADVNEKDEEGRSALHFACGYGEIECAKLLLDAGADIDTLDSSNNTSLHYAAGYGEKESVKLLVERKANKGLKNDDKNTAADIAKMNEHDDICELLND